jgi:uncharacterized SAM-binding protein YcdF (DUF218 family)
MKKLTLTKTVLILFILCGVSAVLFYKELLSGYASLFDAAGYTKGADAIVILSGNPATRVEKAAALYREGYGGQILLTSAMALGDKYHHIFKTQTQKVVEALAYEGIDGFVQVPSLKGGATSTFDEAYDMAQYAKVHHMTHLILVTDTFHTARALYAFKKVFAKLGLDVKLEAAGASNNHFNETDWWRSEMGLSSYILEPLKFLVYSLRSSNLEIIEETP